MSAWSTWIRVEPVTPLLSAVTVYTPGVWGGGEEAAGAHCPFREDQVISPGSSSMGYQPVSMAETVHWVVAPGRRVRLLGGHIGGAGLVGWG